jgi:predicted lipase
MTPPISRCGSFMFTFTLVTVSLILSHDSTTVSAFCPKVSILASKSTTHLHRHGIPASARTVFSGRTANTLLALKESPIETTDDDSSTASSNTTISDTKKSKTKFSLATALFCGGLAFDTYVEPPSNSSRWEKGSQGLKVAFLSTAFTRQIYKGLVEIAVERITGLPDDESATERLLSGNGVDACLLVAALEGSWKEDVNMLEQEQFHEGVIELSGAAHVGRSSTAWANVDEKRSQQNTKQRGTALPYHIKASWGSNGGTAVWPEPEPFYLYLQDPATARLVFTVLDADKLGFGTAVGSTYKKLKELIPVAALAQEELVEQLKGELLEQVKAGNLDLIDDAGKIQLGAKSWHGELPLTSKPRKKDKNSQIIAGAAAGAMVAGPMGAAAGALMGRFYESKVQGKIQARIRYLPIPQTPVARKKYTVLGGMPGINWGAVVERYRKRPGVDIPEDSPVRVEDLEHCFFINHEETGACCALYRSLEKKLIVISFRGTCAPIDLLTDATIAQDAWVAGEDYKDPLIAKVHNGFRDSLDSISRRLKELVLAAVGPGEELSDYDILVTGHSLGAALATLFTADIGQYGVDAGRGLPQLIPSEPWWKSIATTLMGQEAQDATINEPPRPKSLRMYNYGSPRVGNEAFADLFDALRDEGFIDQAYRVVNGEDVVARLPRTVNALVLGNVGYEHVGTTVLVTPPQNDTSSTGTAITAPLRIWVEGESDDSKCPVRDGVSMSSPTIGGSLLGDLYNATREGFNEESPMSWGKISDAASKVTARFKTLSASDVASVLGIDRSFTEREIKLVQSLLQGKALAHHMEDQYYATLGAAASEEA